MGQVLLGGPERWAALRTNFGTLAIRSAPVKKTVCLLCVF